MDKPLLHGWHNVIIGHGNRTDRIQEIKDNKPPEQIDLRLRLMERVVPAEINSRWDALNAEFKPRRDALHAEINSRRDALNAEFKPRWDALDAEFKPRRDALHAEINSRWDALNAEFKPRWDALDAEFKPRRDALHAEINSRRDALHAEICVENCPWDGETIFTHRKLDAEGNPTGDWCMIDEGAPVAKKDRHI